MDASVKARFSNGALTPLEPIELEDGEEVTLTIVKKARNKPGTPTARQTGEGSADVSGARSVLAMVARLKAEMPEQEHVKAPPDGARNYKHYLYGFPKDDE